MKMWGEDGLVGVGLSVLSVFIYSSVDYRHRRDRRTSAYPPRFSICIPFVMVPLVIGPLAHAIITVLTMVGSSNAVNLTDGRRPGGRVTMIIALVLIGASRGVTARSSSATTLGCRWWPAIGRDDVLCAR